MIKDLVVAGGGVAEDQGSGTGQGREAARRPQELVAGTQNQGWSGDSGEGFREAEGLAFSSRAYGKALRWHVLILF